MLLTHTATNSTVISSITASPSHRRHVSDNPFYDVTTCLTQSCLWCYMLELVMGNLSSLDRGVDSCGFFAGALWKAPLSGASLQEDENQWATVCSSLLSSVVLQIWVTMSLYSCKPGLTLVYKCTLWSIMRSRNYIQFIHWVKGVKLYSFSAKVWFLTVHLKGLMPQKI